MATRPNYRTCWIVLLLVALAPAGLARAQDADDKEEDKGPPDPVTVDLTTKDYLQMKVEYYGGTKGKETVPIVILHDLKGNRSEFGSLALYFQRLGHAVIVPDLRGHGASTEFRAPNGRTLEIRADRLRRADFANMILYDLETVRKFIKEKNNAGELNLNALSIVGSGMGSVLALNWAARDWSAPRLTTGKQGQDVKAMVLVSPTWSYQGVTIDKAIRQPGVEREISMLILVGDGNARDLKEAKRLYKSLEGARPEADPAPQKRSLFLGEVDTPLQGTKLLTRRGLNLEQTMAKFFQWRVVDQDFPWDSRLVIGN